MTRREIDRDELRALLAKWGRMARQWPGPPGYPRHSAEQAPGIVSTGDEWDADMDAIECAILRVSWRPDGGERLRALRAAYIKRWPRADQARWMRMRLADYLLFVEETERLVLDIWRNVCIRRP